MCPPTHFSHALRPRPFPASFPLISLPDKFFPPSHSTQQAAPLWVCSFGGGLHCDRCASLASLDRKKKIFVTYGNIMRQAQALINYKGSFAYSQCETLCK